MIPLDQSVLKTLKPNCYVVATNRELILVFRRKKGDSGSLQCDFYNPVTLLQMRCNWENDVMCFDNVRIPTFD